MVPRLILLCLFGSLVAASNNFDLEGADFDFENGGYPEASASLFRANGDVRQMMMANSAEQDDDEDDDDAESENNLESLYFDSKPVFNAKPVAQAASKPETKHRSYCHPPNPCPKGHTPEKNGCDAGVRDTADWNRLDQERNMRSGKCACDVEHMFTCPPGVPTVSVASAKQEQQQQQGSKQQSVGAKRSPRIFI